MPRLAVCLGLALTSWTVVQAGPEWPPREQSTFERWLTAVDQHVPGRLDQATADVSRLSRTELWDIGLSKIRNAVDPAVRAAVLKRGAMLHTDIAMIQALSGEADSGRQSTSYEVHLDMASRLLEWVPDVARDPDAGIWHRALTAWLFNRLMVNRLTRHLDWVSSTFGDDARWFFDTGVLNETLAAPMAQNRAPAEPRRVNSSLRNGDGSLARMVPWEDSPASSRTTSRTYLQRAERRFARALDEDPAMVEARIRLGRVQGELGRHESAVTNLTQALDVTSDPTLCYFTYLFLGRVQETIGDDDAARISFEQAARLFPLAQSPFFSLGRMAETSGDHTAGAMFARVLSLPRDEQDRVDPWWSYHYGSGRNAGALVRLLQARIALLPRMSGVAAAGREAREP